MLLKRAQRHPSGTVSAKGATHAATEVLNQMSLGSRNPCLILHTVGVAVHVLRSPANLHNPSSELIALGGDVGG